MLDGLRQEVKLPERKASLFALACCRYIWCLSDDKNSRRAVEVAERYADGFPTDKQLSGLWKASELRCIIEGYYEAGVLAKPYKDLAPALAKALKDPREYVRSQARAMLVRLDGEAVPTLLKVLEGEDKVLRKEVAGVLADMAARGGKQRQALLPLSELLKDGDKQVREAAAYAISEILKPKPLPGVRPRSVGVTVLEETIPKPKK